MPQYNAGTVSTVIDTNVITGVNTAWLAFVQIGDQIKIGSDTTFYDITGIVSNTSLTISANYPSTKTTQNYIINSDFTANLSLPLVSQGDAYFADTYSRAMRMIDAALGLGLVFIGSVIDKDLDAAPGAPSDGDAYIVASPVASGDAWFAREDYIAVWDATAAGWAFTAPVAGYLVFVEDENALYIYTGSSWIIWSYSIGNPYYDQTIASGDLDSNNLIVVQHNLGKALIHATFMDVNLDGVRPSVNFTNTLQATVDFTGLPTANAPWTAHFSK